MKNYPKNQANNVDTKGEILLASNSEDEGKIKLNEEYFVNAKEKTYFQEISYDVSVSSATLMVGTPIKNAKNELVGVLAGRVAANHMTESQAITIAKKWLWDNPNELYKLGF